MPTSSQSDAMNTYANVMQEVKIRLLALNGILANPALLPDRIVYETAYTQIRISCELVALGCLVAHGDIAGARSSDIMKDYHATKIFRALGRMHPEFFPTPHTVSEGRDGVKVLSVRDDAMTKAALVQLYEKCGSLLHRGSLKELLTGKGPFQKAFPEPASHAQQILGLLAEHHIRMIGGQTLLCTLESSANPGNVSVAWAG